MGKFTPISSIGEHRLIEIFKNKFSKILKNEVICGIGDDAAVINQGNGEVSLVTTDFMIEGVHFDIVYTNLKYLGYKLAVVNFSDIYAMNGTPLYFLLGIGVTSKFSVEMIEEFMEGVYLACQNYNVSLIGGDSTSAVRNSAFYGVCIGKAHQNEVVYRKGAQENDVIAVTGELGSAYAGLLILEKEKIAHVRDPSYNPDLSAFAPLIKKILMPNARKDVIEEMKKKQIKPTSMIDISDSLTISLSLICRESGVGAKIFEDKIPVERLATEVCAKFNLDIINAALYGGEDYELLMTFRPDEFQKVRDLPFIHPIGFITKDPKIYLINNLGNYIEITPAGWDPFLINTMYDFTGLNVGQKPQ